MITHNKQGINEENGMSYMHINCSFWQICKSYSILKYIENLATLGSFFRTLLVFSLQILKKLTHL